jgi:3-oxoisoapionate decarboxylase
MRLGVDSICLGSQGWTLHETLEYAAGLGLDTVQLPRKHLASLEDDYLLSLRHRADELGLSLEVGAGCLNSYSPNFRHEWGSAEDQMVTTARAARILGSNCVQCFLGSQEFRLGLQPFEQHVEEFVRVVRAVGPLLQEMGIKLALENHCDFLAREIKDLVEEVGSDYLGVCLDTGNPAYICEDPTLAVELLAPYTLTTHVRDSRVWAVPEGAMAQWVPTGQGDTDLYGIAAILEQQAPAASFNLEIITGGRPRILPHADPESEIWRMFPNMLAHDFARFSALAQRGRAEPLDQVTVPPGTQGPPRGELAEQLKAQQSRHFEESVRYCQEVLGIGSRGRLGQSSVRLAQHLQSRL